MGTFNVENCINSTKGHGDTAPERVIEQIEISRERLKRDRASIKKKRDRLKTSAENREKAIKDLIGS